MGERQNSGGEQEPPTPRAEAIPEGRSPVIKKLSKETRKKASKTTRPKKCCDVTEEEEHIISAAATYCLLHFPMLWTTGGFPEDRQAEDGSRQWLIRVYLRYPTGFEGYLGDLLYDGKQITELTDRQLMMERAKQVAADPEGIRQWNEYRASNLPAGET